MTAAAVGALAAGLLGSPHCAGMCGGFVTACTADGGPVWPWQLGRLFTYLALGALAGAVGAFVPGPSWVVTLAALALLVWFSLRLAGLVPEGHWRVPGLASAAARLLGRRGIAPRVGFGVLTGLMPCGLVYAALSLPVAVGDPLRGALLMAAFWLGTVPVLSLAAIALQRLAAVTPWVRRGVAMAVLAAGVWALGLREVGLVRADVAASATPPCHDVAETGYTASSELEDRR